MKQSRAEVWSKWRGLVAEQAQSGSSVARFCFERGLSSGQFYSWKKKLSEADTPRFVSLELTPLPEAKWPGSVMHSRAIEVRLTRGCSLVVEPGFDAHHLRALLAALEGEA